MDLPDVCPASLIDCRIGTPEATAPEKVRDQRASATFWTTSPMWKGIRSLIRSHWPRPRSRLLPLDEADRPADRAGIQMNQ